MKMIFNRIHCILYIVIKQYVRSVENYQVVYTKFQGRQITGRRELARNVYPNVPI